MTANYLEQAIAIEQCLIQQNLRGMAQVYPHLTSGYYLRAAQTLSDNKGTVLIGTGFPVAQTFETDGPVGAIALYQGLKKLAYNPVLVCGDPLFNKIKQDFNVCEIPVGQGLTQPQIDELFEHYQPSVLISIERPGKTQDGSYRNMRGEDISGFCGQFDEFITQAKCPTIAIGDGGNEIGMGNVAGALVNLDIMPAITKVDELLIADVSNWGAYGILACLSLISGENLLEDIDPESCLKYLSERGSVDGVTKVNSLTEDSLNMQNGIAIINQLQSIISS